jgi:histone H3/H4
MTNRAAIKTGDPDRVVTECLLAPDLSYSRLEASSVLPVTTVAKKVRTLTDMQLSHDVPGVLTKALELMVSEVTLRALLSAKMEDPKRRRLRAEDLTAGISSTPKLDFLRDVLPPDELQTILAMPHSN